MNSIIRNGNFTSSGIVALMSTGKQIHGFGVAALTYIMETNIEREINRSIDTEINSKPTSWGNLCEPRVHELLPTSYIYSSQITDINPEIDFWVGSKDGMNTAGELAVTDIKCPLTLKSFIQLVMPLYCGLSGNEAMYAIRNGFDYKGFPYPAHKDGEKYYWQLVSNACHNNTDFAELIVYMPYQSELLEIKKMADGNPSVYWLNYANEEEIPYLVDGGKYKNLNIIRFKIPQEDKDLLKANVLKAGKLLTPRNLSIAA